MRDRNASLIDVAPLSMAVLAGCIVYYAYMAFASQQEWAITGGGGLGGIHIDVLIGNGASFREGIWDNGWQRFVLPMFLHASLIHIFFNMLWLWNLGPSLETHFGSANFGSIYFLSGLGGICLSVILSGNVSIGASGCVFGMMGATLAIKVAACPDLWRARRNSEVRKIAFFIVFMFLICLLIPHIDHWAHLGGLVLGTLYGWLFEYWRKNQRVGLALILGMVLLSASGVIASRWMVFNPHYHIYQGVKAEQKGDVEAEAEHFKKAVEWSRRWRSASGEDYLIRQFVDAHNRGESEKCEKYDRLLQEMGASNWRSQIYYTR